jgi:putative ABC transport system ATP-binding protein
MSAEAATGLTVSMKRVCHSYGSKENPKQVLHDIDFDLMPGEVAILTGPSGSGKTTLLTLIGALRSVQEGEAAVLGRRLRELTGAQLVRLRREIGFIFQAHNLFESLTARENVNMAIELTNCDVRERDRRCEAILTRLGLSDRVEYKPNGLSGGQRQRVAIARALANRPKLVLADEPTAALDKLSGREVVDILKTLALEEQSSVLIVTHDTRILDLADRIIKLVDGRIVSDTSIKRALLIATSLQRCSIFAQQPIAMLTEFAAFMRRESFDPGEDIIREGEAGDKFYVIESGSVEVLREKTSGDSEVARTTLGPGDFFGEVALLTGAPRNATVIARDRVEAFTLAKEHFDEALQRSKTLEERLRTALYYRS